MDFSLIMQSFNYKLEEFTRNLAWYLDYALFILLNPFKFKFLPRNPKSILVVERLFLGDLIVITPMLSALKQKYPNAKLSVLVHPVMKEVLLKNPNVDEIVTDITKPYDLAIILHPGIDWGSFKTSVKIFSSKFRIGSTKVGLREGKGFFLNRKTIPTFKLKHKIEDNLDVIRLLGIRNASRELELHTTKEAEKSMAKYKNCLIIHASPQHETHKWSKEKFAQLADILSKKYKKIVFTGSRKDIDYNNQIIDLMKKKAINLAGKTSLQELFALVKNSKQVISVDTGTIHVAAAFNKPLIALFGAGNPRIWAPYSRNAKIIFREKEACTSCMKYRCKKGNQKCMNKIEIKDVL